MNTRPWAEAGRKLMTSSHSKGWIRGDLRDANLICDGEKLMLDNFDRGGKAMRYPVRLPF